MSNGKYLIINADGYGFTPGVNAGIIATFESGMVTSTSCTPNFGHLDEVAQVQARFPHISFGIHFNLNVGRPCAPIDRVKTLVGDDGCFLGPSLGGRLLRGKVKVTEIETELAAQAAMLADQGIKISHWDGHQNKHLWPIYFEAASRVARHFGITAIRSHRRLLYTSSGPLHGLPYAIYYLRNLKRLVTHTGGGLRTRQAEWSGFRAADHLITPGYADDSHKSLKSFWYTLADSLPRGYSEVYCHPGFPDDLLRRNSKYVEPRADEVRILTEPGLPDYFRDAGVTLINFWDLKRTKAHD